MITIIKYALKVSLIRFLRLKELDNQLLITLYLQGQSWLIDKSIGKSSYKLLRET